MKRISVFIFSIMGFYANAQHLSAPLRLRTDLIRNAEQVYQNGMPVKGSLANAALKKEVYQFAKIYSQQPVFNWEVDASVKKITACQLLVASSAQILASDKADFWDSKKISTQKSRLVYSGKILVPGKTYYWKVKVWDDKNTPTTYSTAGSFYLAETDTADKFSHHPLTAEIQQPVSISKKENGSYFIDFGKDGFSQVLLHLTSNISDSIWIEAAEALESPGNIQRLPGNIRYIKRGLYVQKGTHDYKIEWPADAKRNARNPVLMPAYMREVFPFRYLVISNFSGELNKRSVERKMVFYPFDNSAASFHSSDSVLNKVWELCKYSIKATSFSGYYVDGDRERLPYEADALINQLSHYSVDAEYSIARRSMDYVIYHPTWPTEWSLQNVLLAWNDYLYTGDDAFLRQYYTELQKKILMPLAGPTGLISTRAKKQEDDFLESIHMVKDFDGKHGLKDNVDWPQKGTYIGNEKEYGGETDGFVYTDYNSVINAFYYRTLILMNQIAETLGKKEDAAFYLAKSKELYQSYQTMFRDTKTGLIKDGDTTNHSSLHANFFALAFGLIPKENIPGVIKFIKTRKMACSVYGSQFLLDALYDAGEEQYALELMTATTQRSWYNMIRVGSTITMEAWDKLYKPNLDWNHAWGSAPANIIVRKLMGVEPTSPGSERIRIKPQLGDLRFADLTTTTLKGLVRVSCKRSNTENSMTVSVPGATVAEVWLAHDPQKKKLIVDGQAVSMKPQNGFYIFPTVGAGTHTFKLQ